MRKLITLAALAASAFAIAPASATMFSLEATGEVVLVSAPVGDPLPTWVKDLDMFDLEIVVDWPDAEPLPLPTVEQFFAELPKRIFSKVFTEPFGAYASSDHDGVELIPDGLAWWLVVDWSPELDVYGWTLAWQATPASFSFVVSHDAGDFDSYVFDGMYTSFAVAERLPHVPDSGSTAALAGLAIMGLFVLRRRIRD